MAERLDQALAMNQALASRMGDLERRLAGVAPAADAGAPERRIETPVRLGRFYVSIQGDCTVMLPCPWLETLVSS
jgi:hypothetical protein